LASIENITAGKLLQKFISGYDDEPFGEQGLVIVKQLLDLAFPNQSLSEIISSSELLEMLTVAAEQYNFRKKPSYLALMNFILEKTPQELQKMNGTKLKKELTKLLAVEAPLSNLEIDRSAYDLSGNPESASLARNLLEVALISTTASLFEYLLIEDENRAGKLFRDLDSNCRFVASRISIINPLCILLKELLSYKWQRFSIVGSLPTLEELETEDVCKFVEEHPQDYLERIKTKFFEMLDKEFRAPLSSLINSCIVKAEKQDNNFELEIELELLQSEKVKQKLIRDLKKLQSRLKAGKKVTSKEFDAVKAQFFKECDKLKQEISKEFQNFVKKVKGLLAQEPPWFKYYKKESHWQVESSQLVMDKLNGKLSIAKASESQSKSKSLQKAIAIFEQLGGIHFAMENIFAHYFYERVPSRLVKLVETPAKRQKIKELKFLQEKRYSEGLTAVRSFLVPYSETMISGILSVGFSVLSDYYIKDNPVVLIDEEKPKHPKFLDLLNFPKNFFEKNPPETLFGDEYFSFQMSETQVKMGFHLKSLNGKGNDLFKLLVSSTALENAQIYKSATKILGKFCGYVYSAAIGNMRVCPPALKAVDDLFM
jgi:hypothetical protein